MSSNCAIKRHMANGHCSVHPGAPRPTDVECDIPPTLPPEENTARGADVVRPRVHVQYNATTFYVPTGWDESKHLVKRRLTIDVDTGRVLSDERDPGVLTTLFATSTTQGVSAIKTTLTFEASPEDESEMQERRNIIRQKKAAQLSSNL